MRTRIRGGRVASRRPMMALCTLCASIFLPELTALRAVRPRLRRAADRVRDLAPARRSPTAPSCSPSSAAGAGDRLGHGAARHAAGDLRLRARQRRADPRPRGVRDRDPVPARAAGADGERAAEPAALGAARGPRLGGVPRRQAPRALPRQGRGRDPRLQRGRERRRRGPLDPRAGLRRADTSILVVDDGSRDDTSERGREGRRDRRPPRDQPRRRRGAAHRLPADVGVRGARRRHPRRRRPAPARARWSAW